MLFAIHAQDKPGALETRLAAYDAHKAFLADTGAFGVQIVMSGPLTDDTGGTMLGSLLIIDAPDKATAIRFNAADPFSQAGVWDRVTITGFIRRQG